MRYRHSYCAVSFCMSFESGFISPSHFLLRVDLRKSERRFYDDSPTLAVSLPARRLLTFSCRSAEAKQTESAAHQFLNVFGNRTRRVSLKLSQVRIEKAIRKR